MKDRIKELAGSVLTLLVGSGLLYLYLGTDELIAKILLYLVSIVLVTIGLNQFAFFFESLIRKIESPRVPFSEIFIWLSPCLFMLYQFYTLDDFILKVVFLTLTAIFALIFVLAFGAAMADSALAKKKINIFVGLILLSILVFGLSHAFKSTEILLLFPIASMLLYTNYVQVNYLKQKSQSSRSRSGHEQNIAGSPLRLLPINIANITRKTYWLTPLLMVIVFIIFILYVKNLLPIPDTISSLYAVSLTLYTFLLSIITAFAILILRHRVNKRHTKDVRRALLGLAQMCMVFILTSLLGTLIGIDIDNSIFATGTTLTAIFGSGKTLALLQVFVFEFILLSFPPAFMYLYAMLKGFIFSGE